MYDLIKSVFSDMKLLSILFFLFPCRALCTESTTIVTLADPTIFYHEGVYYLYGSGGDSGIPVYTSTDMQTWDGPVGAGDGYALKKGDHTFGEFGFWAPQVFYYQNKFYMAYTAEENIAIAVSDSPLGPFTQQVKQPLFQSGKGIDPFIYMDDDGKKYLYYVNVASGSGNRIFVAEMENDLSAIRPGTTNECLTASSSLSSWERSTFTRIVEGPTVVKQGEKYFLIYSANAWTDPNYAIGYATSTSPAGPWTKYSENPILNKHNAGINGTGHGDLFKDVNGDWKYVFHTHYSNDFESPRKTAVADAGFINSGQQFTINTSSFYYLTRTVYAVQHPVSPIAIPLTAGTAYVQNFNSLQPSGNDHTVVPAGWAFLETGVVAEHANGKYWARGGVNRQDTYSFGNSNSDTERAFGSVVGANMHNSKIGAKFVNNTGKTITKLLITYAGEQWRKGASGVPGRLSFSYSKAAEDLGTEDVWAMVPALDFTSVHSNNEAAVVLDGNIASNRNIITYTITGVNIADNETFWIRWENARADRTSDNDALAIDDFSITPVLAHDPISLNSAAVAHTQNFDAPDGLKASGDDQDQLPLGWAILETGGAFSNGKYFARAGNVLRHDTYSFGASGTPNDRALGSIVGSNMQNSKTGAKFINNTGEVITELQVSYVGEQWRTGGSGTAEKLFFTYSTDAGDLVSGNWISVSDLDFTSINTGTTAGSYSGNEAVNRKVITHKIEGLNIGVGSSFWIRWENAGLSSTSGNNGDGLAVDDFSLIPNPSTTPVSLGSFTHKKTGNAIQFNWETLSEQNNDYFEIQRSANGTDFTTIASIPGNGNSVTKQNYTYTDFSPIEGISYYQLKQVDRNGEFKIYPPVSVTFGVGNLDFTIYSSEDKKLNLNIYAPSAAKSVLQVVDINGREILKNEIALIKGYNGVRLNLPFMERIVVVVLSSDSSVIKKKFVQK